MTDSITNWLTAYRAGDQAAANELWNRYYKRLVHVARLGLRTPSCGTRDEEDIALSAFNDLFSGIEAGRFPDLADRHGLWHLLVHITGCKIISARRRERSKKRSVPDLGLARDREPDGSTLDKLIGYEPTAEFCAQAAESLAVLLESLPEGQLRQIAVYKMEGYSSQEVAQRLGCSLTTVERKLRRIRHEWSSHLRD